MGWRQAAVVANLIIVQGPGEGIFSYSPSLGFGNLVASTGIATGGTDPFGNVYLSGDTTYSQYPSGIWVARQISAGGVAWWQAASEAGPWSLFGSDIMTFSPEPLIGWFPGGGFMNGVRGSGNFTEVWVPASGDTSGVVDTQLITALAGSPGPLLMHLLPGIFYLNSTVTLGLGQYVAGSGMAGTKGTIVNWVGTGDCFRQTFAGPYSGVTTIGGGVLNLTIDGSGSTAPSTGIHAGDIESLTYDRTYVRNFSGAGSVGYHFDNTVDQTERLTGELHATNCTSAVVFDVSGALTSTISFARPNLLIYYTASTVAQNGVVLQNGAFIYHAERFSIRGNHAASASGTPGSVLTVTGVCPAGHPAAGRATNIGQGNLDIGMETNTSAVQPVTITFGSGSNTIVDTQGLLDFTQGSGAFTGSNIGTTGSGFRHFGTIHGDTTLVETTYTGTWAQGAIGVGGTIFTTRGGTVSVNPAGAVTGVIIAVGARDGQELKVKNLSGNSVTFAVAGTSNVAAGAGATIPALTNRIFIWDTATSLWYGGA